MKLTFLKKNFLLALILLMAILLRFGGISWGLPYHFHPDEWNMAAAVARLSWQNRLNPEFFAYGQFPLYLAYFSAKIYNLIPWLQITKIDISEAVFFLRFWSAIAGVGTVYLVYLISRRLVSYRLSLMAALLAAPTPGLIQISHFGTTESLLSFFFLAALYFSLKILEEPKLKNYVLVSIPLGLALGVKISAIAFFSPLFVAGVYRFFKAQTPKGKFRIVSLSAFTLALALVLTFIVSPYLALSFHESLRILSYETQIAQGLISIFYTRQFVNTIPIVFQIQKVFPYALGWPIFILGSLGFTVAAALITKAVLKRKISNFELQLLTFNLAFLIYFLSQAFLFTKWARFMAPVFAFFPIFAVFSLSNLRNLGKKTILAGIVIVALLPGLLFSSIYFRPDIRFTASEWIYRNIPNNSVVLSETGNVVDIPILSRNSRLPLISYHLSPVSFDFYHLDEDPILLEQLLRYLEKSDYIFVPSRRIFVNHLRLPEKYPLTAKYYDLLFSGKLGFTEIKKFESFPHFSLLTSHFSLSDEPAEETWSVFDHPTIRIYQKSGRLSREQYESLFQKQP